MIPHIPQVLSSLAVTRLEATVPTSLIQCGSSPDPEPLLGESPHLHQRWCKYKISLCGAEPPWQDFWDYREEKNSQCISPGSPSCFLLLTDIPKKTFCTGECSCKGQMERRISFAPWFFFQSYCLQCRGYRIWIIQGGLQSPSFLKPPFNPSC